LTHLVFLVPLFGMAGIVFCSHHHRHHHHLYVIKQVQAVTQTPICVTGQQGTALTAAPSDVQ